MNSIYGLLDTFNSSDIKIIDYISYNNKKCILYSNGKIVYEDKNQNNTLHIDISLCTGFGFVQSIDEKIRVYTCSNGIVTIYFVENNDIIRLSLPNSNYHVKNNSVKYYNDNIYLIAGVQKEITQELIDEINRNLTDKITIDNKDYAITNYSLFHSVITETVSVYNTGRFLVSHHLFGIYNIINFGINGSFILVVCKDGSILYTTDNKEIQTLSSQYNFYPGITAKLCDPKLSIQISDYKTLKTYDLSITNNSEKSLVYMRFFTYCPDGSIRYCDIFENNMAIVYYSNHNNDNYLDRKLIIISDVSYNSDFYTHDTTFNNPDRVVFSNDGSKIVISRGKYGAILVNEDSYRVINKDFGFNDDCEIINGIFGDDGYLYLGLRNKGYILRNIKKDNYSSFYDIISSSMIITDGKLDIDTKVSNIISTDNGIFFYCQGKHESLQDPGTYIVNSGFYNYNSNTTKLTKIESFDYMFLLNNKRVFLVNDEIFTHEEDFNISIYNRFTFNKSNLTTTNISNCKIIDIFKYKNDLVFHVLELISGNNYTTSLISYPNSSNINTKKIQLGNVNNEKNIVELVENKYFSPYISFYEVYDDNSIFIYLNTISSIILTNIHISGEIIKRNINIPFLITTESKINVKKFDKYIIFSIKNALYKYENTIQWKYYIKDDILEEVYSNTFDSLETSSEDTYICKSVSTTNIRATEGFIFGDNCLSDFGSFNVRYNPQTFKSTRSFYTLPQIDSSIDKYIDRITDQQVLIQSICSLKPGYTFLLALGIGRDDCKVYLAIDNVGDIRCIWEYSTNNNDIVDLLILGNIPSENDIPGYELLGTASPGNTKFSNIDRWYIGDINNSVVGFRFLRDGSNNKTKYIESILFISVKTKFIFQPTELTTLEIPNFIQILDDTQSMFKIYCKEFGQKFICVSNGECKFGDIFSRNNPENYIGRDVKTIIADNFNINYKSYFKSLPSITSYNNTSHIRYMMDILQPVIEPYKRDFDTGIEVFSDTDDFYICSMVKGVISSDIEFIKFDTSYQGLSKVIIYLELDMNYGNLKDNSSIITLLRELYFSSNNGVLKTQLQFVKDLTKDNIYYSEIDLSGIDLEDCIIFLSNQDDTHITRFRIWSNGINEGIISRTPISLENCDDVDISNIPIEGYTYDDIRIPYTSTIYPQNDNKNVLLLPNNSTICCKFTPNVIGWLVCDSFNLFNIDNYSLLLQLASISNNDLIINCKIDNSSITSTSFILDKTKPVICRIKRENDIISIKIIQDNVDIIIIDDFIIDSNIEECEVFNFYFGEINYLSIFDDIIAYSSEDCTYIGDNVYGNVVSMIRDHKTGELKALVSPSSNGILSNKGILEYNITENTCSFNKYITDFPLNDLNYGELGFCENSAFTLICGNDSSGNLVNIFNRKYPESIKRSISPYLLSIGDEFIVDSNGNRILISEFKI